jgi:hypothetical protein
MGVEKTETREWPLRLVFLNWTQGYLTAMGVAEVSGSPESAEVYRDNLLKSPAIGIAEAILSACRKRPQEKLELVSYRLYRQLGGTFITQQGVAN